MVLPTPEASRWTVMDIVPKDYPELPVVISPGYGTVKSAVEAVTRGSFDYTSKPVDNDELKIVVRRALEMRRLTQEHRGLSQELRARFDFDNIVGRSVELAKVKALAKDLAVTDSTVLISGESGTGKELLARAIHYAGPRAGGPMIAINCAALPELLLESELFGYEKGAFTDARKAKPGRLLLAHRGTLFLDEIDEMSHAIQAKLLRVLEDHMIEPLGGVKGVKVDLRLLVATNQELRDLVRKGKFREALFYRVSVCQLPLPPLREGRRGPPVAVGHFLAPPARAGPGCERRTPVRGAS